MTPWAPVWGKKGRTTYADLSNTLFLCQSISYRKGRTDYCFHSLELQCFTNLDFLNNLWQQREENIYYRSLILEASGCWGSSAREGSQLSSCPWLSPSINQTCLNNVKLTLRLELDNFIKDGKGLSPDCCWGRELWDQVPGQLVLAFSWCPLQPQALGVSQPL